jgi:hypothetical protein
MSSPAAAQALTIELIKWLSERHADPDDAVPALLVTAAKVAFSHYHGDKSDELTAKLLTLVEIACTEEAQKQNEERKIN